MKKLIFLFLLGSLTCLGQRAVPPLWGHSVHDEANVLSQTFVDQLEAKLRAYEDSTTNQIAVLVIPSLEGESLEEYALRVARDEWKLGQKGKDNGVLLLIVVDERKMRIEVGYGLEGALPDAITSRIIRNNIAPQFREQNYEAGVMAGVEGVIQGIGGEFLNDGSGDDLGQTQLTWKERLLIGAFIFGILGVFTVLGLFTPGCAGWFLYAFLIPFYATFPMALFGAKGGLGVLGFYIISFPIVKTILSKTEWGKRAGIKVNGNSKSGRGWSTSSGWFSGGGSSSSRGWSSGGTRGFSGGGGSFGGGGSSGSW